MGHWACKVKLAGISLANAKLLFKLNFINHNSFR